MVLAPDGRRSPSRPTRAAAAGWCMSHRAGVVVIPFVLFMLLSFQTGVDAIFTHYRWRPLGHHVATWAKRYPLWLLLFSTVLGALLGHFFAKPLSVFLPPY